MLDIFATEPDFVNDQGVKWWKDKGTTQYAESKGVKAESYRVMWPDGYRTNVLLDVYGVLKESQKLEDIACNIDMISMQLQYAKDEVYGSDSKVN